MDKELICVKLKLKGKNSKYRILTTSEKPVYPELKDVRPLLVPYSPETLLEEEEWFKIENASQQKFAGDLLQRQYSTVDFGTLDPKDFPKIKFLFVQQDDKIMFQRITPARLVQKKCIVFVGQDYKFIDSHDEIVINTLPDAIYYRTSDLLCFRKLESITNIFDNIELLYKGATDKETERFLHSDFISLKDNYSFSSVNKPNRKRITKATKTLRDLSDSDRKKVFNYIREYYPQLIADENKFGIGSETELKMFLLGIEERFFTTPVGNKKRVANSIIELN